MNIEHVTSTALVLSVSRSVGKECSIFHKYTAQINGNKNDVHNSMYTITTYPRILFYVHQKK